MVACYGKNDNYIFKEIQLKGQLFNKFVYKRLKKQVS